MHDFAYYWDTTCGIVDAFILTVYVTAKLGQYFETWYLFDDEEDDLDD